MKIFLAALSFLFFSSVGFAQDSQIYINVGEGQVKTSLLALPPLKYVGTQATNREHITTGQDLFRVIYNDLSVSGFFTFVKPEAYLEDPATVGLRPAPGDPAGFSFSKWKTIGTEFLVRGAYQVINSDLTLEIYVYHVPTGKLVMGKNYRGPIKGLRRVAHTFGNDLMQALTGKKGMFLTKFAASRQSGTVSPTNKSAAIKEIYIMDWDGENQTKITSHGTISISPTWSHAGDKVAYTSFVYHPKAKTRNPDLFVFDIPTGKRFLVSYRKGMNSGANFLPGDKEILLTLSQSGSPDIFRMSADGTNLTPLTRGPNRALNVEPAISPDGKLIAFSSDRMGNPHIFVMNVDGTGVRRLTQVGKYNSSPAWSPDGKTIAFAGDDKGAFDIFVINLDGTGFKRLTSARKASGRAANNESPSWSPDGRHILFTSDRSGKYQLYIISPDGTNERRITDDQYNWDRPKWSPYLN